MTSRSACGFLTTAVDFWVADVNSTFASPGPSLWASMLSCLFGDIAAHRCTALHRMDLKLPTSISFVSFLGRIAAPIQYSSAENSARTALHLRAHSFVTLSFFEHSKYASDPHYDRHATFCQTLGPVHSPLACFSCHRSDF